MMNWQMDAGCGARIAGGAVAGGSGANVALPTL